MTTFRVRTLTALLCTALCLGGQGLRAEEDNAAAEPQPGDRHIIDLGSGVTLALVWVPPGTFIMGSPDDEPQRYDREGPRTEVTLTRGFWMGETPVTQAQYTVLMGLNPSEHPGLSHPVTNVNFEEAMEFCEALSGLSGLHVTLPTEAQWEYACRAGTTTPFSFGESSSPELANYHGSFPYGDGREGRFRGQPSSVRIFPPNDFGLHDMHGNVYEWCLDFYGPYPGGKVEDWIQPSPGGNRSIRGGSWQNHAHFCRSAARLWARPHAQAPVIGFRVVATEEPSPFSHLMPISPDEAVGDAPPPPPAPTPEPQEKILRVLPRTGGDGD